MGVKIRDKNKIPELIKSLNDLKSKSIKVGIFGEDDSHILMIANVHEYGASITVTPKMRGWFMYQGYFLSPNTTQINIPERSFMRSGYDNNKKELERLCLKGVKKILASKIDATQAMELIGTWLVSKIQSHLRDLKSPPNAQMTVDLKKSSNPLIDTGRLIQSITYKVE